MITSNTSYMRGNITIGSQKNVIMIMKNYIDNELVISDVLS